MNWEVFWSAFAGSGTALILFVVFAAVGSALVAKLSE